MKRFLVGADRGQSTLLPECLDEWIDESNPVRAVDAFVRSRALCLRALGRPHNCARVEPLPGSAWIKGDNGFCQQILLVDDIDAELVTAFAP